jgi:hypothetical protein
MNTAFNRVISLLFFLFVALTYGPRAADAMGGQFGMEFAIDAPWRMEPVKFVNNTSGYGPIPITITFLDGNFSEFASSAGDKRIGRFLRVEVIERDRDTQGQLKTHKTTLNPSDLREIERKLKISTTNGEAAHEICHPNLDDICDKLLDISVSRKATQSDPFGSTVISEGNEWHAMFWYTPKGPRTPGRNVHLEVSVFTESDEKPRMREWKNFVIVHLGEKPLPRFADTWMYGDLHYHSQMTDNEGESGYSYRNTIRTLNAMGMDFAFATDHASGGEQLAADSEARDLNQKRFQAAKEMLYGENAVNHIVTDTEIATAAFPLLANLRRHSEVFMGEELDVVPEMSAFEQASGTILFGDGQVYPWADANGCVGKVGLDACKARFSEPSEFTAKKQFGRCTTTKLFELTQGMSTSQVLARDFELRMSARSFCNAAYKSTLPGGQQRFSVLDMQGLDIVEISFLKSTPIIARQHMVYFPRDNSTTDAGWVVDNTSEFGGATRLMQDMAADISAMGIAFLAHPADGARPGGNRGPDVVAYSRVGLENAWRSPGITGLQLWNEDRKYVEYTDTDHETGARDSFITDNENNSTDKKKVIYHLPWIEETRSLDQPAFPFPWLWKNKFGNRDNFDGSPLLSPDGSRVQGNIRHIKTNAEIYHGLITWDHFLRKGLDRVARQELAWLPADQPRKWFMAGGSDAHGDFNYRREGRPRTRRDSSVRPAPWSDFPASDSGIGKPRNLVLVGNPSGLPYRSNPTIKRIQNTQVISALRAGKFSVTDGPALRIVIDKNRNGVADEQDFQMGSFVSRYPGEQIPVIIQWQSTPEFGRIKEVQLYVGNKNATFSDTDEGPDREYANDPSNATPRLYKGYRKVPNFKFVLPPSGKDFAMSGQVSYFLDPQHFMDGSGAQTSSETPTSGSSSLEMLYVRAFAKTVKRDEGGSQLQDCPVELIHDSCGDRQAFTNPIWIGLKNQCAQDAFSIDANNNRMPDVCEAPLPDACTKGGSIFDKRQITLLVNTGPAAGLAGGRSCRATGGRPVVAPTETESVQGAEPQQPVD